MAPMIWLGEASDATRLSAAQLALPRWLKLMVVSLPTLNDCQFSTACDWVWSMLTVVWPLLVVCVGVLAPTQVVTGLAAPGALSPLSGTRPPMLRPFGTVLGAPAARPRAALCAARKAWIACVARAID